MLLVFLDFGTKYLATGTGIQRKMWIRATSNMLKLINCSLYRAKKAVSQTLQPEAEAPGKW